jgi:hypothetical protein
MKRVDNSKQSLRNPGADRFINCVPLERHRGRRRFIGFSVIKFAIEHHSDWNQAGFAVGGKLEQGQRTWSFAGRFTTSRLSRNSLTKRQGQASQHDDGARRQV